MFLKTHRITGIMSLLLILCLPLYIGYESKNPVYFDRYSPRLFQIIVLYISFVFFADNVRMEPSKKDEKHNFFVILLTKVFLTTPIHFAKIQK